MYLVYLPVYYIYGYIYVYIYGYIYGYIYEYISRCEAGVGECCGSLLPGHPVQVCRYNNTEWEVSSLVTPTLLNITAHRWIVDSISMYHFT